MKNKLLLILFSFLVTPIVLAATLQSLPKDKVMQLLQSKSISTMPLTTLNSKQMCSTWTGEFSEDGKVKATMDPKPSDAVAMDNGTWTVSEDGLLCITWQKWKAESNHKGCVYLYEVQNGYLVMLDDGKIESIIKK